MSESNGFAPLITIVYGAASVCTGVHIRSASFDISALQATKSLPQSVRTSLVLEGPFSARASQLEHLAT